MNLALGEVRTKNQDHKNQINFKFQISNKSQISNFKFAITTKDRFMDGGIDSSGKCYWVQHIYEACVDGFSTWIAYNIDISLDHSRNFFSIRRHDHG